MDPRGVAQRRTIAQSEGHKLADNLQSKTGVFKEQFIAAQARGENTEDVDFLIGVTVDVGQGSLIAEQVNDRSKQINKTKFTRGDRVVAVRWLHRFAGDTTGLTFVRAHASMHHDLP